MFMNRTGHRIRNRMGDRPAFTPSQFVEVVTSVAIKTHSSFSIWEASTESRGIVGSLWISLQSRINCAF
jgi:hypothetical protein